MLRSILEEKIHLQWKPIRRSGKSHRAAGCHLELVGSEHRGQVFSNKLWRSCQTSIIYSFILAPKYLKISQFFPSGLFPWPKNLKRRLRKYQRIWNFAKITSHVLGDNAIETKLFPLCKWCQDYVFEGSRNAHRWRTLHWRCSLTQEN